MNNNLVPQKKSDPTTTLLIYKKLILEISAAFYICVSSFNFGILTSLETCATLSSFLAAVVG